MSGSCLNQMNRSGNKILLMLSALSSIIFFRSMGKVCQGTNSGMSIGSNPEYNLRLLEKRYDGCTVVEGNLEVSGLTSSNISLSFLKTIEEVTGYVLFFNTSLTTLPLENLILIRGQELFQRPDGEFGLLIAHNLGLTELGLRSLTEISHGGAWFTSYGDLCFIDTVMWNDIFSDEQSFLKKYNQSGQDKSCRATCHISCPEFEGKRYCWGPSADQCQKLTKALCHEDCKGRCFGKDWNQCCSESCAGGCNGRSNKDCFKCRNFSDDGACVEFCPPPIIYDPILFAWEPNPLFKYSYSFECVTKCPDSMFIDQGACVRFCSEGYDSTEPVCKPCVGACPKVCPGTLNAFLNNVNIESFRGCKVVQGNLYIGKGSFIKQPNSKTLVPLTYDNLTLLEDVTLITGSFKVDADSPILRNMSFLRNLKTVMANKALLTGEGFFVQSTSLEILGLDSLQSVMNGNLTITGNKNLCFVEEFDWKGIRKNPSAIMVQRNQNISECKANDQVCHQECAENSCLGPLDSQCFKCRTQKQGNRCVPACEVGWFPQSVNGSMKCLKCHSECRGSCFGPASDDCHKCKHFQDGRNCVETCHNGSETCMKAKTKI